jgi:transmembrane sensor
VHTGVGGAEDIGTEFVVTAYPEANGMQVAVASGMVQLGAVKLRPSTTVSASPREPLLLTRGDLGRLDSVGVLKVEHGVDVDAQLAWTRGELVFRRTPLRLVIPQLERWYGVDIRLADSRLNEVPVSASFADEGATQAVTFVAAAINARLVREVFHRDSIFTLFAR